MANLKDTIVKPLSLFHAAVYKASGGRFAKTGFGMPVVILTTTGRKTGKSRTTTLTSPVPSRARRSCAPMGDDLTAYT